MSVLDERRRRRQVQDRHKSRLSWTSPNIVINRRSRKEFWECCPLEQVLKLQTNTSPLPSLCTSPLKQKQAKWRPLWKKLAEQVLLLKCLHVLGPTPPLTRWRLGWGCDCMMRSFSPRVSGVITYMLQHVRGVMLMLGSIISSKPQLILKTGDWKISICVF